MFYKVLIAVDSSPSSLAILSCARSLYLLGTREYVLAQCFRIREHVAFPDQIKDYVISILDRQKGILERQGIRNTVIAEPGLPAIQIPRIAKGRNCSLIVVGSHGHNLVSEILLGSTATEIIHQAKKRILIIQLKADEQTGQVVYTKRGKNMMHHVLCATDFSDHSVRAFDYVSKFVECGALRVTLLHVQDKARLGTHLMDRLEGFNEIDQKRLELLKERLEKIGNAQINIEISYGSPTSEILERTKATDISVTIMGSHGRRFASELFLGSVSHNIARHSEVPVLLIPRHLENASIAKESHTPSTRKKTEVIREFEQIF